MRLNFPPNWPPPPPGWTPPPGWQPDPSWGPPPQGWQLWVPEQQKSKAPLIVGGLVGVVAVAAIVLGILYFTVWSKESDDEQIRAAVTSLQDAYNDSDFDAWKGYQCGEIADQLSPEPEDFGAQSGGQSVEDTVESVEVDGDKATVSVESTFDNDETSTDDVTFVREDGEWKSCGSQRSDEVLIRSIVAGLQEAWNDSDSDAFADYLCEDDREEFLSNVENGTFGSETIELTVQSVELDDDQATVSIAATVGNEDDQDDEIFISEDGKWKFCPSKKE